jgi:amino acid transporter
LAAFIHPAHHGDLLVLGLISLMPVAVMWLNGFQPAASAVEERAEGTSFASVARAMMLAVVVAALFYSAMIAASSALVPWRELTTGALPVAAAFDHALPDGMATRALLIVALASLLKTWNAMHLSATRVLLAQGRAGFLPPFLARITPQHGAPRNAALLVGAIAALGVLAGRGRSGRSFRWARSATPRLRPWPCWHCGDCGACRAGLNRPIACAAG